MRVQIAVLSVFVIVFSEMVCLVLHQADKSRVAKSNRNSVVILPVTDVTVVHNCGAFKTGELKADAVKDCAVKGGAVVYLV